MKRIIILFWTVLLLSPSITLGSHAGLFSTQLLTGYIVSPVIKPGQRPDLNYLMIDGRFEWLRLNPHISSYLEATYSETKRGPKGYMAGFTLLGRYKFKSHGETTPYLQLGVGVLYNDIYKDKSQNLIGNNIEFNPQLSLGIDHKVSKHFSVDVEGIFHHVSNAGLKRHRNVGVNGLGLLVGFTYRH